MGDSKKNRKKEVYDRLVIEHSTRLVVLLDRVPYNLRVRTGDYCLGTFVTEMPKLKIISLVMSLTNSTEIIEVKQYSRIAPRSDASHVIASFILDDGRSAPRTPLCPRFLEIGSKIICTTKVCLIPRARR